MSMRATCQLEQFLDNAKCSLNEESLNSLDKDTDTEGPQTNGPATSHIVSPYPVAQPQTQTF